MRHSFVRRIGVLGQFCTVRMRPNAEANTRYEVTTGDDCRHFWELTEEERNLVMTWLRYNVIPGTEIKHDFTTNEMRMTLQDRTNIALTNNQFKEAMLVCGFCPAVVDEENWRYYLRRTAPIIFTQADGKPGIPMLGFPMQYKENEEKEGNQNDKAKEN